MKPAVSRFPLADAMKAIAAQVIVLHHLAHYGPMSDVAAELAPGLFAWLDQYGRMAVHVFLAVAGYLAARTFAPAGVPAISELLPQIGRRYLRLAVPYAAALVLAIVLSSVARQLMQHDSISAPATVPQVVAHLLFLQGLLDFEALTAGAWYLAIDFQLFALLAFTLWLLQRLGWGRAMPWVVALIGLASLIHFNRQSDWDDWALYFFGSYALGALAYWGTLEQRGRLNTVLMMVIGCIALAADFRWRILVALVSAILLLAPPRAQWFSTLLQSRPLVFLGRISFSTFLVHFPVCLVVNAVFIRIFPENPVANTLGVLLAWVGSIGAGAVFEHFIHAVVTPQVEKIRHTARLRQQVSTGFGAGEARNRA
ncbi:MAG: acyltransferase [Rhodocyclaceae bacterium]|nr:MAG: acyltransferase [Rhodocyclaceae bacterium]